MFDLYVHPHAAQIIYAGLFLAAMNILQWWWHKDCQGKHKPTLLRPKWKRVDSKRDFDRYTDE